MTNRKLWQNKVYIFNTEIEQAIRFVIRFPRAFTSALGRGLPQLSGTLKLKQFLSTSISIEMMCSL